MFYESNHALSHDLHSAQLRIFKFRGKKKVEKKEKLRCIYETLVRIFHETLGFERVLSAQPGFVEHFARDASARWRNRMTLKVNRVSNGIGPPGGIMTNYACIGPCDLPGHGKSWSGRLGSLGAIDFDTDRREPRSNLSRSFEQVLPSGNYECHIKRPRFMVRWKRMAQEASYSETIWLGLWMNDERLGVRICIHSHARHFETSLALNEAHARI